MITLLENGLVTPCQAADPDSHRDAVARNVPLRPFDESRPLHDIPVEVLRAKHEIFALSRQPLGKRHSRDRNIDVEADAPQVRAIVEEKRAETRLRGRADILARRPAQPDADGRVGAEAAF